MPHTLDPELRRALAERVRFCHEMGIYDFYRREARTFESATVESSVCRHLTIQSGTSQELREEMAARKSAVVAKVAAENILEVLTPKPEHGVADPVAALKLIREDLGDCTRCKLHKQGRKQIVFGVGNPRAELMFVGEGPGADEDTQGEPFVGRAGQLLNNMIKAMGIRREDVYIANVVKCRPPGNRTPERDECETCSPFLMRQIAVIKPKVMVALGASRRRICSP
jgi:uracil-DNA glycosylase